MSSASRYSTSPHLGVVTEFVAPVHKLTLSGVTGTVLSLSCSSFRTLLFFIYILDQLADEHPLDGAGNSGK